MYIFIVYVGFEIGLFWFDKGEIAAPRVTDKLKLNIKYNLKARTRVSRGKYLVFLRFVQDYMNILRTVYKNMSLWMWNRWLLS